MNKSKIGLVHYTYPPAVGGVEKVIFDHAQLFAKYGYDTTVFAGEGQENNPKIKLSIIPEFKSLRTTNHELYEEIINNKSFPQKYFEITNTIYQKIEKEFEDRDVLIIHNVLTFTFNLCLNQALIQYIKKHPEKKFIAWTHDVILNLERTKNHFSNPSITQMVYQPIKNVRYVGISNFLIKNLEKEIGFLSGTITLITNGIDINTFLNLNPTTQKIINKYNIFDYDYIIFCSGKVQKHKNVEICIETLKTLKELNIEPLLIISAKGTPHNTSNLYFEEIKNLIKDLDLEKNVIVIKDEIENLQNNTNFQVIEDFYRLSDIVINLSSYENFGLPLIEAGINKTPIIVNNLKVFREIDDKNLYFVDIKTESPKDIAQKIDSIIKSNKQLSFLKKIRTKFNLNNIFVNQIIPLIEK